MARLARVSFGVALVALLSGPAFSAGSQTNGVAISGSAVNTCTLSAPTVFSTSGAALSSSTLTSGTIAISDFVDTSDATYIDGVSIILTFDAMCNYPSHFNSQTLTGGLKSTTPVVAGSGPFVTTLNYSAGLTWGGQTSNLGTNGSALRKGVQRNVAGSFKGTAQLNITLSNPTVGSTPVVAGAFTDQLTIQIGAAL